METVDHYIQQVENRWKPVVEMLRKQLRAHIDTGFVESLRWGMITYEVPMEISGPTYNKQPLAFVSLAAQKHHCSLYLMAFYASPELQRSLIQAFEKRGLKPDMGKSCIRFKRLEDIPLEDILLILSRISVDDYLAIVRA